MAPTPSSSSALRRAWLRWKSLQLPWRKHFLVGESLPLLYTLFLSLAPAPQSGGFREIFSPTPNTAKIAPRQINAASLYHTVNPLANHSLFFSP